MLAVETDATFTVRCASGNSYVINIGGWVVALETQAGLFTRGMLVISRDVTVARKGLPGIIVDIGVHYADHGCVRREASRRTRALLSPGAKRRWLKHLLEPGRTSDIFDVHFVGHSCAIPMKARELAVPPVGTSVTLMIEPVEQ